MIDLYVYSRPDPQEPIEVRHADIVAKMRGIDKPLGWRDARIPLAPKCDDSDLSAHYQVRCSSTAIKHHGMYKWRNRSYLSDNHAANDDNMSIALDRSAIDDYSGILCIEFPRVIAAFSAYRASAYYDGYLGKFHIRHAQDIESLRRRADVNINGRNNIFTLNPAQYWDAGLCQRAMGYGRDEVIRRLDGHVPLVRPLMDGVYVVFNDNPDLTFEEYCAYNDRLKPILGLV